MHSVSILFIAVHVRIERAISWYGLVDDSASRDTIWWSGMPIRCETAKHGNANPALVLVANSQSAHYNVVCMVQLYCCSVCCLSKQTNCGVLDISSIQVGGLRWVIGTV